ncbi:hypothetical protein V6N12_060337 [Hibiscus sabdariffa]|uniref:RNase H type-1 domain-containing protein n=1 Tax=Hibiscus sabdariffa TaxID=183260 RepID=A0ABR2D474_9ROSI
MPARLTAWSALSHSWVKFNVHGARRDADGRASCGSGIRDSNGGWCIDFLKFIGSCSVIEAELWGCTLVRPQFHAISNLVMHIFDLCGKEWSISFHHVFRSDNKVANYLAKLASWNDLDTRFYRRLPYSVIHLLQDDAPPLSL